MQSLYLIFRWWTVPRVMTMLGFYISWRSNRSEVCEGETCLTLQSGREGVSEGRETSQLFTHTTTNQIAPTKHRKHRGNHQQYKGSPRYHLVFQCWHRRRKHGVQLKALFRILKFYYYFLYQYEMESVWFYFFTTVLLFNSVR